MKKFWTRMQKIIPNRAIRNILIILVIYNAFIYTNFYFEAFQNNRIKKVFKVPEIKKPDSMDTVLVLAPHPDDESLGPGGYIKKAIKSGAEVYVVLMTYGDGYKIAAETEQGLNGKPESLIRFGKKRRIESISALTYLGVKRDHIYFLGFPDRGISPLWINYWENLYRSPLTKVTHSPYSTSYVKNTPYKGKEVFDTLSHIIEKLKPNIIFLPSPFDFHVDHWSTYSFSIAAILSLIERKKIPIPSIYTYLVHYRDFPYPKGYYPKGALLPPKDMKIYKTKWRSYDIEDVEEDKKKAILRYKTQLVFLKRLLLSFVRTNELWGEVPEYLLENDYEVEIPDLITDVMVDYIDTGANIRYIDVKVINEFLTVRMILVKNISKKYLYHLRFFIPKKDGYIRGTISYTKGKDARADIYNMEGEVIKTPKIKTTYSKNKVNFIIPIHGISRILIGCDTNLSKKTKNLYIDTTGEFIINLK